MSVIPEGEFGERVTQRLRQDRLLWLTTIGADGTPQPNPVWFLWEEPATVLIYNTPSAHRLAHIRNRPRVALNFDTDGKGGDVVVLTGDARVVESRPLPHVHSGYLAKYEAAMARVCRTPERFSEQYSVPMEITLGRVRGF